MLVDLEYSKSKISLFELFMYVCMLHGKVLWQRLSRKQSMVLRVNFKLIIWLTSCSLITFFLPLLTSTGKARVVNLSSRAHLRWQSEMNMSDIVIVTEDTYDRWLSYGRSKLCNILFTKALAERFPYSSSGVTVNALHPGLVNTNLLQNAALGASTIAGAIPVEEGIRSIIFLATAADVEGLSGQYYFDCQVRSNTFALILLSIYVCIYVYICMYVCMYDY